MICSIALVLLCLRAIAGGEMLCDPVPPMRWQELADCELVVVARYDSHDGDTVKLTVDEVLKGTAEPGDVISVRLEHWYSVETGPIGWDLLRRREPAAAEKTDGIPKLCYKEQLMNPGGLVPVPVLRDVHQVAIYFFPDQAKPVLKRRQQVQEALFLDGWKQLTQGQPPSLLFRLMQPVDPDISRRALEELYERRDPDVLQTLTTWTVKSPGPQSPWDAHLGKAMWIPAMRALREIGDKDGDVYEPMLRQLKMGCKGGDEGAVWRVESVMARVNPERTVEDLERLIREQPPQRRHELVAVLDGVYSEPAVELLVRLVEQEPLAADAVTKLLAAAAVTKLRHVASSWGVGYGYWVPAPSRQLAAEKLKALLAAGRVSKKHEDAVRELVQQLWPQPPDIEEAERLLTGELETDAEAWPKTEAYAALKTIGLALDAKYIPVLVEAYKNARRTPSPASNAIRKTLDRYDLFCPNATQAELAKQKIRLHFRGYLRELQGPPRLIDRKDWLMRHPLSPERLEALKKSTRSLRYLNFRDLSVLFDVDPTLVRQAVRDAAERLDQITSADTRACVLALAIREFGDGRVEQLIQDVRTGRDHYCLLISGSPKARKEYLRVLDEFPRIRHGSASWQGMNAVGRLSVVPRYHYMLEALLPHDPEAYVQRILELADSDIYGERRLAERLIRKLDNGLDYYAADFADQRERKLPALKEELLKLANMTPTRRAVTSLRRRGIELKGELDASWAPQLIDVLGSSDGGAAKTAQALIEKIMDRRIPLWSPDPTERRRRARAWLQDAGVEIEHAEMANDGLAPKQPGAEGPGER